jgi:hypothetical protein
MLEALLIIIADMNVCALQTSYTMRDLELSGSEIHALQDLNPICFKLSCSLTLFKMGALLPTSHTMRDLEHSESKIPRPARYQPFMLEALLIIIADMNVCALQTSHTMRDLEHSVCETYIGKPFGSASPGSHALHDLSPLCLKLSCSLHL